MKLGLKRTPNIERRTPNAELLLLAHGLLLSLRESNCRASVSDARSERRLTETAYNQRTRESAAEFTHAS
jgi:hypothetical protein